MPLYKQRAATSAQLAAQISDETGTAGSLVFSVGPTITTLSAASAGAGTSTPFTMVAGGNLATDTSQFRITSLAGTVVYNSFGDALNGNFRNKALGAVSFHAGNVGVSATNEFLKLEVTGACYLPGISTTASAANAFIDNGTSPVNSLLRSTSSIRYKKDVEPLDKALAARVLELEPIWYRSRAVADNPDWSWYGLSAEQVAVIDPRLVTWTYPDDAYETVEIEGIEVQDTEEVQEQAVEFTFQDGRAIAKTVTRTVTRDRVATYPVFAEDGTPIIKGEQQATVTVPVMRKQTETVRRLKAGAQKVPDGVQYERLTVLLLALLRDSGLLAAKKKPA